MEDMEKSIVLYSGGYDSSMALIETLEAGRIAYPLMMLYGQKNAIEMKYATALYYRLLKEYGETQLRELKVLDITQLFKETGGSVLTSKDGDCKRWKTWEQIDDSTEDLSIIEHQRNAIFLSIAARWASTEGANELVLGTNSINEMVQIKDNRRIFTEALGVALSLGSIVGDIRVVSPILRMKSSDIVRRFHELGYATNLTWSCWAPVKVGSVRPLIKSIHCGHCMACWKRKRAHIVASEKGEIPDLTEYSEWREEWEN